MTSDPPSHNWTQDAAGRRVADDARYRAWRANEDVAQHLTSVDGSLGAYCDFQEKGYDI
jgi:hypothetical protein